MQAGSVAERSDRTELGGIAYKMDTLKVSGGIDTAFFFHHNNSSTMEGFHSPLKNGLF